MSRLGRNRLYHRRDWIENGLQQRAELALKLFLDVQQREQSDIVVRHRGHVLILA